MTAQNPSLHRTRIKFCGITRLADARLAVELGVDALGFVFAAQSPRYIEPAQAAAIRAALPPLVSIVALFQNQDTARVRAVIELLRPDLLQFHGSENAAYCEQFGLPYIKAVSMQTRFDPVSEGGKHPRARALLLDSHKPNGQGGTGQPFDWNEVPATVYNLILAGGLNDNNVARAIQMLKPYAVDVSSGIETIVDGCAQPGIKDPERMRQFVRAVRAAGRPPVYTLSLGFFLMGLFLWLLVLLKK